VARFGRFLPILGRVGLAAGVWDGKQAEDVSATGACVITVEPERPACMGVPPSGLPLFRAGGLAWQWHRVLEHVGVVAGGGGGADMAQW
jgi:hypothetical protein